MWANINAQYRAMKMPQGQSHLHEMPMSGAVCQHRALDPTTRAADKARKNEIIEGDREGKSSTRTTKGGKDTGALRGGTGKYQYAINTPLPIQKPERRREGMGRTHSLNHKTRKGRREIYRITPRPQRTSESRRYTGTGWTPMPEITSMGASRTRGGGRGSVVIFWSCLPAATTRWAGR